MIIKGNIHTDHRGVVRFVNDFKLDGVKRLYSISHPNTNIVRGWQGHKEETKYFYAAKSSFRIDYKKVDDWQQPTAIPNLSEKLVGVVISYVDYIKHNVWKR